MKLVTYGHDGRISIGAVVDETIIDLSAVAPDMLQFIEMGPAALASAALVIAESTDAIPMADVHLLAPIPNPRRNIMCVGKNYAAHARESNEARGEKVELPKYPVIFTKATTSMNGPFDDVPVDPQVSNEMDFEAELGVVMGRAGRNIGRDEALDYVFGYTVVNDVTARDLQQMHNQFFKGKSLDGSCPTGPCIVTADEIPNPQTLGIQCIVNGELVQNSTTADMIFSVADIIYHLANGMTLLPGDIIATGTPEGVGFARKPPVYLHPGDDVECHVEHVGTIRNQIVLHAG